MLINGLVVIEDMNMVDRHEDWSEVRSPGRARRRLKQGHPQRIKITGTPKKEVYQLGDRLYMHPAMAATLRATIKLANPGNRPPPVSRAGAREE